MSFNVLVYGNGGREHAICESILKSKHLKNLFTTSNSFGYKNVINAKDYDEFVQHCKESDIDFVIIGPEAPICDGLADILHNANIRCIAVDKYFSIIEASKLFAKKFMERHGIKTAKYFRIAGVNEYPTVIKADGLCKGKGVKAVSSKEEAETFVAYLKSTFPSSTNIIFAEEFLEGEEISVMSLFDGKNLLNFPPARDFKRLNSDENSPNTGGMGAYCPVKLSEEQNFKLEKYLQKLNRALLYESAKFTGFIYSGLIWAKNDWHVLEYNVRLGDPETQAILNYLETDFLEIMIAALDKKLDKVSLQFKEGISGCLTIAAKGYPDNPICDDLIEYNPDSEVKIYNAGVKIKNGKMYSNGGRVLSLCTCSASPFPKLKEFAEKIKMENKFYRNDIDI